MQSTEIIDLLPPIERLSEVYKKFVANLEKKLAEDEKRLDETFEVHRAKLHRVHQKTVNSYEVIFNQMLKKLEQQEDIPLVTFFEKAMRSKNIHLYSSAVENLQPNLDNVEENGGSLVFSSKITDGSYSSHYKGDYFGYFQDFWGIDESVVFKVRKEYIPWDYDKKKGNQIQVQPPEPSQGPSMEEDLEKLREVASDTIPDLSASASSSSA
jgi:hypothetical protein